MFLSVGQWFDVAADGKQIAFAFATRSSDGITWTTMDLRPSLGSLHPTQLVRFGDRWVMAAESWDDATRRQTPLFSSVDGVAWDRIAPLDFALQFLRATTFGLFAMGDRDENNSTQWVTAASIDERAWSSSILNIGMTRRSNRCSSTAIEWS